MALFPFFVNIEGADGLIIGGGHHALEKVERLKNFGPKLHIIASSCLPELEAMDGIRISHRKFVDEDLAIKPVFVVVAVDDQVEAKHISMLCKEQDIPVNVVDNQELCSFVFPSLIVQGDLAIGISTAGASPAVATKLRQRIEQMLPNRMEVVLEWLRQQRGWVKENIPEQKRRRTFYRVLADICLDKNRNIWEEISSENKGANILAEAFSRID